MIDLDNLGDGGLTIVGPGNGDLLGFGYGGRPGDVNGDGIADLIIPAPGAGGATTEVYVVFGGPTLLDGVDLVNLAADEGVLISVANIDLAGR